MVLAANKKPKTFPQLRQAMIRMRSETDLSSGPYSASDVHVLLDQQRQTPTPDIKGIATAVSKHLNIRLNDMKSSGRCQCSAARVPFICRQFTSSSFGDIGRYFGKRDHSTIMHAFKRLDALQRQDASIRQALDECKLNKSTN